MPASNPVINVKISSKADEFQAGLAQVRKDLADLPKLAEQVSRDMGRSSGRFAGFDVGRQISRATSAARSGVGAGLGALGAVSRMVPGLGGIAGAASIAGVGELMNRYAGGGIDLKNTARLAGTSAAGLNSLRGAARMVGLTAGDADQAMSGLNHALADATYGRNPDAARFFQQFGVDFGSMALGARTAEQVLPSVVDSLTKLAKQNPLAAERLASVWGIPASALPMMIRGREALEGNRREVELIFGSMNRYIEASEGFTGSTARMGLAADRLGMTITSVLEPHLTPLLTRMASWAEAHDRDIGEAFDRIGTAVEKTDWASVGRGVESVGSALSFATKHADQLTTALEALAVARGARWLAGIFGWPALGVAAAGGAAGAAAGAMNTPMVDDMGRVVGNWGGSQGEANQAAASRPRISRMAGGWEYSGEPLPAARNDPTSREQEEKLRVGRNILMNLGWTREQAAGIMSNLQRESKLNETAVGDGGQAFGVAQWHPSRRAAIQAGMGRSVVGMSYEDQIRAIDWELRHSERAAGDALRRTTTAADAGAVVYSQYERPLNRDNRQAQAAAAALGRRWEADPPHQEAPAAPPQSPTERYGFPDHARPETWPKPPEAPGSTHTITLDINGAPEAASVRLKSEGSGAEIGGIRIRRAMPQAGESPFNPFGGP